MFRGYVARKQHHMALDYDDLLLHWMWLCEDSGLATELSSRFDNILVDEYQDTNRAQYLWVKQLAAEHHNLAVVGDDDQSIYSWRGADLRNAHLNGCNLRKADLKGADLRDARLRQADLRKAVRLDTSAVGVVENAFSALAAGNVIMPPILSMEIPDANGEVDVKTAWIPGFDGFAIKVSPGFFDNPKIGLPSLNGLMILFFRPFDVGHFIDAGGVSG